MKTGQWTKTEELRLADMAEQGMKAERAAFMLERSVTSVLATAKRNGLEIKTDAGTRPCLKCKNDFWSEGKGDRICPNCETNNARTYQPPYVVGLDF